MVRTSSSPHVKSSTQSKGNWMDGWNILSFILFTREYSSTPNQKKLDGLNISYSSSSSDLVMSSISNLFIILPIIYSTSNLIGLKTSQNIKKSLLSWYFQHQTNRNWVASGHRNHMIVSVQGTMHNLQCKFDPWAFCWSSSGCFSSSLLILDRRHNVSNSKAVSKEMHILLQELFFCTFWGHVCLVKKSTNTIWGNYICYSNTLYPGPG